MIISNIPFLSSYQIHTLFLPSPLGFLLKKENQDKKICQVQFFLTWTHGCVAIHWYMVYGTGVTNLLQTVFLFHWLSIVSSYSPRGDISCLLYLFMLEIFQDWVHGAHVLPQLLWVYNSKLPWSFHKTLFLCFLPSPLTLIIFLTPFSQWSLRTGGEICYKSPIENWALFNIIFLYGDQLSICELIPNYCKKKWAFIVKIERCITYEY